jgi:hypothetical protein
MELPEKSGLPQIEFPDRRPALRPLRTAVSMARARAIPRCASVLNIISRRVNHEHARRRADTERENFDPENRRIPAPGDPHNRRNGQGAEPLSQTGHDRIPATRLDAGNRGSVDIGGTGRVLGKELPLFNVLLLSALSLIFIGLFVYLNFYRFMLKGNVIEYCKRVCAIYFFSLVVVGALLTIIERCPWGIDNVLAIKRILIVAFPAAMSASLSDSLK